MSREQYPLERLPSVERNRGPVPFVPREGAARAPLLFILAGLSVSIMAVSRGIPAPVSSVLAPLTVWGLLLILSEYRPPRFFSYGAFLSLLAFACALSCGYRLVSAATIKAGVLQDEGTVVLERSWGSRRIVLVDASSGTYLMRLSPNRYILEGDALFFTGRTKTIAPRPGSSFREDLYWEARGVSIEVVPESITRKTGGWSLARWRTALRKRILLTLPYRTRGYLLAAVLGVRDPDLTEAHRRWGTSHLLAVSGFHVGLVAFAVWRFLSFPALRLVCSRRLAAVLSSLFLWGYVLLAGGAPGALRAALMIQALLLGTVLGRKGTPLNSVSLAALLLLLWHPAWFFDIGWRLSVMAALLLAGLGERRLSLWMLPLSSLFIWFAAFPQVTATFGEVPVAGIALNLVALPLFSLLYPIALFLSLPLLLSVPSGEIFAGTAEGLFSLWEWVADSAASFFPWTLSWSPLLATLGGGLFLLTVTGGLFPLRGRTIAGAGILLLAAVFFL